MRFVSYLSLRFSIHRLESIFNHFLNFFDFYLICEFKKERKIDALFKFLGNLLGCFLKKSWLRFVKEMVGRYNEYKYKYSFTMFT